MSYSHPGPSCPVRGASYAAVTSDRPNFPRTKSLTTAFRFSRHQASEDHRHCPVNFSGTPQQMRCEHSPRTSFPFLKLPVELRLRIYRECLVQEAPIELWPHVKHNTKDNINLQRATTFGIYRTNVQPCLRLCRTNRLIHNEATQIFYGENKWRFSGINGWIVFSCWLYTVGWANYRWLKHVSIHIALPGRDYVVHPTSETSDHDSERICGSDTNSQDATIIRSDRRRQDRQMTHFRVRLQRFGLRIPYRWWGYKQSLSSSITLLTAHCRLRTFQLIHPPTYYIYSNPVEKAWYWSQFTSLYEKMRLKCEAEETFPTEWHFIFLKYSAIDYKVGLEHSTVARAFQPWLRRYTGECRCLLQDIKAQPWLVNASYGLMGRKRGVSKIVDRETCEKLCRIKALEREERDDGDWVNF